MTETAEINNNKSQQGWLDDFNNVSKDQMVRGHTPEDIEAKCLELVQSYIGGSWNNATSSTNDITVERVSGGFTNQLYRIQLKDSVPRTANPVYVDEPTQVAIKLYQEKHIKNYNKADPERLNDTIILNVMSQSGLGPTVYGIFENGFIQAYHKHEQFRGQHMENPQLRRQLMKLLATIAHLKVPIRKDADLLLKWSRDFISYGYENFAIQELTAELQLEHLQKHDVLEEFDELVGKIEALKAPIVFAHNDFRGSNLLVVKDGKGRRIFACDLEHAGYGSRGYDLATIFWEWTQKGLLDMTAPPPTDEDLTVLLKAYIECCDEVSPGYSSQPENSFEAHFKEVKLNSLYNKLFFVGFLIGQKENLIASMPIDRKKNLGFAETIFADYLQSKAAAIKEGYL